MNASRFSNSHPMARFSLRRLLKYWDGPRGSKLERMARHERGACPQRPVTSEKRSQTPNLLPPERGLRRFFALSGVAPHSQTHKGYAPSSRLTQTKNQRQRGPFHYFSSLLGGKDFCCRNLHFDRSPKKLKQDPNPFLRGEQASNQDLQASKRPFNNFNRLANFDGRIAVIASCEQPVRGQAALLFSLIPMLSNRPCKRCESAL